MNKGLNEREIREELERAARRMASADPRSFRELFEVTGWPKDIFKFSSWTSHDFSGQDLSGLDFSSAKFENCDFYESSIFGALLPYSQALEPRLQKAIDYQKFIADVKVRRISDNLEWSDASDEALSFARWDKQPSDVELLDRTRGEINYLTNLDSGFLLNFDANPLVTLFEGDAWANDTLDHHVVLRHHLSPAYKLWYEPEQFDFMVSFQANLHLHYLYQNPVLTSSFMSNLQKSGFIAEENKVSLGQTAGDTSHHIFETANFLFASPGAIPLYDCIVRVMALISLRDQLRKVSKSASSKVDKILASARIKPYLYRFERIDGLSERDWNKIAEACVSNQLSPEILLEHMVETGRPFHHGSMISHDSAVKYANILNHCLPGRQVDIKFSLNDTN